MNNRKGFTLLEIILGVLIFTIVIAAVYTTFRTGLIVYRSGTSVKQVFSTARAVLDIMQPDCRSVCAIEETMYDVPPPPPSQDTTEEEPMYSEDTELIEETNYSRNPYPFYGTNSAITFYSVRENPVPQQSILREQVFGLRYYIDGTKLVRERADLSIPAQSGMASVDELAEHVVAFKIRYGYTDLKENKFVWVDDWDSRHDKYRHPREENDGTSTMSSETKRIVPIRIYPDLLPEAIEISFSLQETEGTKPSIHEYVMVTKIPTALPPWE